MGFLAAPVYAFFWGCFLGFLAFAVRGFLGYPDPPVLFCTGFKKPSLHPYFWVLGFLSIFFDFFPSRKGVLEKVGVGKGVFFEFFGLMS